MPVSRCMLFIRGGVVLGGACTACAREEPVSSVRTAFLMWDYCTLNNYGTPQNKKCKDDLAYCPLRFSLITSFWNREGAVYSTLPFFSLSISFKQKLYSYFRCVFLTPGVWATYILMGVCIILVYPLLYINICCRKCVIYSVYCRGLGS